MPGELKPLVRGWAHERRGEVHLWRWKFDQGEWVAACAGAGVEAATQAFAEVEKDGAPDLVISVGWAGALSEEFVPGKAYWIAGVIDVQSGERFRAFCFAGETESLKGHGFSRAAKAPKTDAALAAEGMQADMKTFPQGLKCLRENSDFIQRIVRNRIGKHNTLRKSLVLTQSLKPRGFYSSATGTAEAVPFQSDCWLVTSSRVADAHEKRRLASTYQASLVDMEAAGVARLALMRGIPFYCCKGISDGYGDQLPDFNKFIPPDGQFRLGRFVVFAALRPWHWASLMRMGENSSKASQSLRDSLLEFLDERAYIRQRNGYPNLKR